MICFAEIERVTTLFRLVLHNTQPVDRFREHLSGQHGIIVAVCDKRLKGYLGRSKQLIFVNVFFNEVKWTPVIGPVGPDR